MPLHYYFEYETHDRAVLIGRYPRLFDRNGKNCGIGARFSAKPKRMRESLLNATWDWGGGDFEMAIGGAGHMGRRDIALFLISQGGRFDLFVAAMLGRLDVVKPMLTAFPHLAESKGPHGIPLMVHAQKGGQEAAEVAAFLEGLKSRPA